MTSVATTPTAAPIDREKTCPLLLRVFVNEVGILLQHTAKHYRPIRINQSELTNHHVPISTPDCCNLSALIENCFLAGERWSYDYTFYCKPFLS